MRSLDLVRETAQASEAVDGAAPLDEATWLDLEALPSDALAEKSLSIGGAGWRGVVDETGFCLEHDGELHLVVHPDHRGRGLATAWLKTGLDSGRGDVGRDVRAWAHGQHPAVPRLAARFGFTAVRDLWVMRRDMSEPLPDSAPDPRIRTWRDKDAEELLRVNAAAFAHHPEQGRMDAANLAARMAQPWFDPAGLFVATDAETGRLLGFHWTKQAGPEIGEVYVVGIDPQAQGRGLGSALTLAGLRHLAARGVREVELYVEADNAAAIATYERLGFTHAPPDTHVMWARGDGSAAAQRRASVDG